MEIFETMKQMTFVNLQYSVLQARTYSSAYREKFSFALCTGNIMGLNLDEYYFLLHYNCKNCNTLFYFVEYEFSFKAKSGSKL